MFSNQSSTVGRDEVIKLFSEIILGTVLFGAFAYVIIIAVLSVLGFVRAL